MKNLFPLLITLTVAFPVSAESKEYKNCTAAEQSRLVEAEAHALQAGEDLSIEIKNALADPGRPGRLTRNDAKLRFASWMLKCAVKRLPRVNYVCKKNPAGTLLASTLRVVPTPVKIFPRTFAGDQVSIASTLLHEAAHKCTAGDALYFKSRPPRNARLVGWAWIADTYGYWVHHGFCIPGETCK